MTVIGAARVLWFELRYLEIQPPDCDGPLRKRQRLNATTVEAAEIEAASRWAAIPSDKNAETPELVAVLDCRFRGGA